MWECTIKGVSQPQAVYAVSSEHHLLQPPRGNDKAKRLGGLKYIKKRLRDKKIKDWFDTIIYISSPFAICLYLYGIQNFPFLYIARTVWITLSFSTCTFYGVNRVFYSVSYINRRYICTEKNKHYTQVEKAKRGGGQVLFLCFLSLYLLSFYRM